MTCECHCTSLIYGHETSCSYSWPIWKVMFKVDQVYQTIYCRALDESMVKFLPETLYVGKISQITLIQVSKSYVIDQNAELLHPMNCYACDGVGLAKVDLSDYPNKTYCGCFDRGLMIPARLEL